MSDFYRDAEQAQMVGTLSKAAVKTYSQRVSRSIADAEVRLADLKRMQEIFAKHPEFEELLTLVQRGRL